MVENKIKTINKLLSLSQSEDGTKLFGKVLVCTLDEGNLNGKGLKKDDITDTEIKSLIEQPIVCKVIKNSDGEYDLSGHNLKKTYEINKDTNEIEVKYVFDTSPIGFFTSSDIEEIEFDGIKKNCIVANVTFWARYETAISVCLSLFDKDNLSVSFELVYGDSYKENDVTWLKDITFIGVALLGSTINGAYPLAKVVELSEVDKNELDLAEAFTNDLIKINNNSINTSSNKDDNDKFNINKGGTRQMAEQKIKNENASLTNNDIYDKVRSAVNSSDADNWYNIAMLYPYEFRAICYTWSREKEEDFVEFSYTVNSDETVSIASRKDVKMVFIPKETMDTQIAELQTKLEVKEKEISEKVDAITKAGEELSSKEEIIKTKDTEIAELTPYKEKVEKAEAEVKEKEIAEKKETLKVLAVKGGYITAEELETSEELKKAIDELDEKSIKVIISDRVIAKLETSEKEKAEAEAKKAEEKKVETSSTETKKEEKLNLNSVSSGKDEVNPSDIMNKFLCD